MYHFLYQEEASRMTERMRLYGVTQLQQIIARIIVTLGLVGLFSAAAFYGMVKVVSFDLYSEDIVRIGLICLLFSAVYLIGLAVIEMIIQAPRIRLLIHAVYTMGLMVLSGALVPAIYFPLYMQDVLTYVPAYEALFWLQEIMLNERLHAEYNQLLLYGSVGIALLIVMSLWKERVRG